MVNEGNELEQSGVTAEAEAPEAEQVPTSEEPKESNPVEDELQKLKSEYQRLSELIGDNPDGYKGLQRKLNQANEELKKRSASESRLDTLEQTQRILVSMIAERENINNMDEIPNGKKTDYLKQFDDVIVKQKERVEQQEFMAKVKDYQERTNALSLDTTSEEYLDIKDFVVSGKFDRADARLKKLEAKVGEKKEEKTEPKETEDEMRKRIEKEVKEQIFKEKGWNISDTGSPSGGTSSDAEFLQEFSDGKRNSPEDFKRARKLVAT